MERKGMLPSFVLVCSICPNMVDLWTWLLMLWMILISDRRITHGRNNRDHNQSIKSQNNVCVHALISWWSLRWIRLVHTFIFSVHVPIFPLFCSKRKGLGLYKTLQEIRLVQYIFASYSNIKKSTLHFSWTTGFTSSRDKYSVEHLNCPMHLEY